jgi:hypothetical protein
MEDILVPISPGDRLDKITIPRSISAATHDRSRSESRKSSVSSRIAGENLARQRSAAIPEVAADETRCNASTNLRGVIEDLTSATKNAPKNSTPASSSSRAPSIAHERRTRSDQETHQRRARLTHRRRKIVPV